MKKALQGFLRGGLLGGLLGLLGGEVFAVGTFLVIEISFLLQEGFSEIFVDFELFVFEQIFTALPGMLFGFTIGAVLGIPSIFFYDRLKIWQRVIVLAVSASILQLLIVKLVYWNRHLFSFGHSDFYELYQTWAVVIWPIYLIGTILYGYYFPTFKPRWSKFLRKKTATN